MELLHPLTWMQNLKQNNIKANIALFKRLIYHYQVFLF